MAWTVVLHTAGAGIPPGLRLVRVLSGIEDADEGGVEDADVVRQGRPAGGVPAGRWSVRCRWLWARCRCLVDDFADGGAGGGFVDEVLAGGERGD